MNTKIARAFSGLLLGSLSAALIAAQPFPSGPPRKAAPYVAGAPWPWKETPGLNEGKLEVQLGKSAGVMTPWHFGQNTSWWSGAEWNLHPDRLAKMRAAGFGTLRFPGGSSSDNYFWDKNYGAYAHGSDGRQDNERQTAPGTFGTNEFIRLCQLTGALPMVTLNYGLSRYGSVDEAIKLALSWLAYFRQHGLHVTHVEVGNENYGTWESGSDLKNSPLNGTLYGKDFRKIAKALRAAYPDMVIGAVVEPKDEGNAENRNRPWTREVLREVKEDADYLIYHDYFTWPFAANGTFQKPSYSSLLKNVEILEQSKKLFDRLEQRYAGGKKIPVVLTEFNIVNASSGQTLEAVNMLFTADILGESVRQGFLATYIWDWLNGMDAKEHGDHGMLAKGDTSTPDNTPRPTFYAYAIWSKAAADILLESSASGAGLRAYATRFKSGEAGLVLINQNDKPMKVAVTFGGYKGKARVNAWCADADSLESKTVRFNQVSGPMGGGGPFPLSEKPYDLTLNGGVLQVVLPAVSVSSCVIHWN